MWLGGSEGNTYVHTGIPFKIDTGKELEYLGNTFVNAMDYSDTAKAMVLVTGDKRIIVYDGESNAKLCAKDGAHKKGILDVKWVNQG